MSPQTSFAFRPWVRRSCVRAGVWTGLVVVIIGAVVAWQGGLSGAPLARALGVLGAYGLVFLASLAKIWWTAGKPAAGWDEDGLWFQALHKFAPSRVPWSQVVAAGRKQDTRAYRLVEKKGDGARERFLNLAVIRQHHQFVEGLEQKFADLGFETSESGWARPGWDLEADHIVT